MWTHRERRTVPLRCIEDGTWKRYTRIATRLVLGAYRLYAGAVAAGSDPDDDSAIATVNLFPSRSAFGRAFQSRLEQTDIHDQLLFMMRVPMPFDSEFFAGPLPRLLLFMGLRADKSFSQPFTLHAMTQSLSFILRLVFFKDCHDQAVDDMPVDSIVIRRHGEIEQSMPHSFGYFRTCALHESRRESI